jgi:hypothetical protein
LQKTIDLVDQEQCLVLLGLAKGTANLLFALTQLFGHQVRAALHMQGQAQKLCHQLTPLALFD